MEGYAWLWRAMYSCGGPRIAVGGGGGACIAMESNV